MNELSCGSCGLPTCPMLCFALAFQLRVGTFREYMPGSDTSRTAAYCCNSSLRGKASTCFAPLTKMAQQP